MIKLVSREGYTFTQSDNNINIEDRILSKILYLGINDTPDNYIEIPDEEALGIEIKKQEYEKLKSIQY